MKQSSQVAESGPELVVLFCESLSELDSLTPWLAMSSLMPMAESVTVSGAP